MPSYVYMIAKSESDLSIRRAADDCKLQFFLTIHIFPGVASYRELSKSGRPTKTFEKRSMISTRLVRYSNWWPTNRCNRVTGNASNRSRVTSLRSTRTISCWRTWCRLHCCRTPKTLKSVKKKLYFVWHLSVVLSFDHFPLPSREYQSHDRVDEFCKMSKW